ncbi:MAG: bifunctional diaminohydroxyphosphoribosylaminopyrimidine deaminase/5-amino-6-(5-phosphoribosylamino)uracil reductase RibD [Geobacter sp.]|nr:MAG: bifunctional diaminohydroxyphosphoribosylaminopyrimidine deaminase/5-amino-6-(5-phosphoribosylamino)uracil reductase RibD [Geobacter sp.]
MHDVHEKFMRRALVLARRGVGKTSPNPAVGCVIARNGVIVGEGWHRKAGTPHAEVHALAQAGDAARGADVYVTLEPCAHHGKTPPCAEALIKARVGRVFAGMVDPNPKVNGGGMAKLLTAGIPVEPGILEEECRRINEPFIKHVITGRPFVTLKSALTLDGKIATATGDSRWITNDRSRRYVHRLRSEMDAVMVGAGTVLADDPQLTARLPGGKDPLRVVVDSTLRIPLHARLLHLDSPANTIIATTSTDVAKIGKLEAAGAEVLHCAAFNGHVDLADLLRQLGEKGVQSVLLEGGRELAGGALQRGLIDRFLLFYAPKIIGGDGVDPFAGPGAGRIEDALRLTRIAIRRFGDDILVEGYPEVSCSQV